MIYLDNAATSRPKPPGVADAVLTAMEGFGNSGRGVHNDALSAARTVYRVRQKLANLFGAPSPERVCFTINATQALNTALYGLLSDGDHAITTDWEHNSVLRPLYRLQAERGVLVDFLPADAAGQLDYDALERLLRPNTKLVVCTHGSNLTGDLLDVERVSDFCARHGLLFVLDASQTAGVLPIDMAKQGVSVVCFTGHKSLLGPQGTGGLCVGEGVEIQPLLVGGTGVHSFSKEQPMDYPTRLEAGTLNSHGLAGLDAALDYGSRVGWDTIRQREDALARRFYNAVRDLPGVTVYGDWTAPLRTAVVSLNVGDVDSGRVSDVLSEQFGIATRPGAHCAPRLHQALGTQEQGAVRFSWGWATTEADTDAAADALRRLTEEG